MCHENAKQEITFPAILGRKWLGSRCNPRNVELSTFEEQFIRQNERPVYPAALEKRSVESLGLSNSHLIYI